MAHPLKHDWTQLDESATAYRRSRLGRPGEAEALLALGEDLHHHTLRLNPDWPRGELARAELDALIALKSRLDHASNRAR